MRDHPDRIGVDRRIVARGAGLGVEMTRADAQQLPIDGDAQRLGQCPVVEKPRLMLAEHRAREQDEDDDEAQAVRDDEELVLASEMGKERKADECDEAEHAQELPIPFELRLQILRQRIGGGVEPAPQRRQLHGVRPGVGVERVALRIGEQIVDALRHARRTTGCRGEPVGIAIELAGQIDQRLEVFPGLELAPLGDRQPGTRVMELAPEQMRHECGGVVPRPSDDPAMVAPDDVPAPRPDRDMRRPCCRPSSAA